MFQGHGLGETELTASLPRHRYSPALAVQTGNSSCLPDVNEPSNVAAPASGSTLATDSGRVCVSAGFSDSRPYQLAFLTLF